MQTFSEKYGNCDIPHREKYGKAVKDLGLENIRKLIPWSDEELLKAYQADKNFNSIKIDNWDRIAGYSENHKTGYISSFHSPLKDMIYKAGVNYFSCSELVCILKEAALQIVEKSVMTARFEDEVDKLFDDYDEAFENLAK